VWEHMSLNRATVVGPAILRHYDTPIPDLTASSLADGHGGTGWRHRGRMTASVLTSTNRKRERRSERLAWVWIGNRHDFVGFLVQRESWHPEI
jgi:hypothetical protein